MQEGIEAPPEEELLPDDEPTLDGLDALDAYDLGNDAINDFSVAGLVAKMDLNREAGGGPGHERGAGLGLDGLGSETARDQTSWAEMHARVFQQS